MIASSLNLLRCPDHGNIGQIAIRKSEEAHQKYEYVIGMNEDWHTMAWIGIA